MPAGRERYRKQKAEMRLVTQKSDKNAGDDRPPVEQKKRAAEKPRSQESILADDEVAEYRGKGGREQIAAAIADDGAHCGEVDWEGAEDPNGISGRK